MNKKTKEEYMDIENGKSNKEWKEIVGSTEDQEWTAEYRIVSQHQ
jgi:hypothetical protein